jgi:hypothetical protein
MVIGCQPRRTEVCQTFQLILIGSDWRVVTPCGRTASQMEIQTLNCMPLLKRTKMFRNCWVSIIVRLSVLFTEYTYILYLLNFTCSHVRFEGFTAATVKTAGFWDVMPCGSVRQLLVTADVPSSPILITLIWRCHIPSKHQFLQELHSITSQKMEFFFTCSHFNSMLMCEGYLIRMLIKVTP